MRTYLIRAVLALAVMLAVSGPAAAQSVVRGKVLDAQGKPVEGAVVTIEATEANRKAQTKTNRNGEFLQVGLASGRYNVTVTKDNLKAVQPANVSQGTPVELTIQLTPSSGLTPEQAKEQAAMQALAAGAVEAMRAGRDDDAIRQFNEIVAKVPTCSDCYYNLGVAYAKKQQFDRGRDVVQGGDQARARTRATRTPGSPTSTTRRSGSTSRSRRARRPRNCLPRPAAAAARRRPTTRA